MCRYRFTVTTSEMPHELIPIVFYDGDETRDKRIENLSISENIPEELVSHIPTVR